MHQQQQLQHQQLAGHLGGSYSSDSYPIYENPYRVSSMRATQSQRSESPIYSNTTASSATAKKKSLQRCASTSPSCEFHPRSSSTSRNTYSCTDSQPDYYHARRAQSQLPLQPHSNPHSLQHPSHPQVHTHPPLPPHQFRASSNQLSQSSSNYVNIEQIERMRRQQSSPLLQTKSSPAPGGFQRSYSTTQRQHHPHMAGASYDGDQGLLSASYANMLQLPQRPHSPAHYAVPPPQQQHPQVHQQHASTPFGSTLRFDPAAMSIRERQPRYQPTR